MADMQLSTTATRCLTLVAENGIQITAPLPPAAYEDTDFLELWLHRKSEKTIKAYSADIMQVYRHTGKSLKALMLQDIQDYITSLMDRAPATQARMIASLKSALSFASKTGYTTFNVGAVIRLPKLENRLAERILSEEDVLRMFASERNVRNHAILVLLYRAGLRASEVCNLQWRHLKARKGNSGQAAIHGKGNKTRFVLLDKKTWTELQALRTPGDTDKTYVFKSRKKAGRLDESQVHRIVKTAAARAEVQTYTREGGNLSSKTSPHWMRHAHATHALDHGTNIVLVKETLGHVSMNTTSRYIHMHPDDSSSLHLSI
jgi:integrase/recombinase XerD